MYKNHYINYVFFRLNEQTVYIAIIYIYLNNLYIYLDIIYNNIDSIDDVLHYIFC